jgi:hypothetical protein
LSAKKKKKHRLEEEEPHEMEGKNQHKFFLICMSVRVRIFISLRTFLNYPTWYDFIRCGPVNVAIKVPSWQKSFMKEKS